MGNAYDHEEWYSLNKDAIRLELSESGADREMDFNEGVEFDKRYQIYLDNLGRDGFLFSQDLIDSVTIDLAYTICTHSYDGKTSAYCLSRTVNDVHEILLEKTIHNRVEFQQEVENLAKYFNVKQIVEIP